MYDAEEILTFIKSRRSTRRFLARPPEPEKIAMIIEAGRYAPSGHNNQYTHFLVITDHEVLQTLRRIVGEELAGLREGEAYNKPTGAARAAGPGYCVYDYSAPCLIVAASRRGYGNDFADTACALQNMMLMANALDLGSCWINNLRWLRGNRAVEEQLRRIGMKADEQVTGSLALGYPDTADGLPLRKPLPRTGNPVDMI